MKKYIYALSAMLILIGCRMGEEPEPEPFIIASPTEYHFGVGGGSVTIELEARHESVYRYWGMGFLGATTNQYGVVMCRLQNPLAPDWEEFEPELSYTFPRRLVRLRTEWFELNKDKARNQITVTVDPNTSGNKRKVILAISVAWNPVHIPVPITQAAK